MFNIKPELEPKVSPTIALNQKVKEMQAAGKSVINMSIGENRFPPPAELITALRNHASQVTYCDPQGIPELRKAVSKYYNDIYSEKHVIISPGSKAGIYLLMMALEGDVMLIKPGWVSYEPQAKHNGKKVFWIDTKFENNYIPTKKEIIAAYNSAKSKGMNPGIIILNYPNNPTSYMPSKQKIHEIANTCKELGLTIISDELYMDLCYTDDTAVSPSRFYPEGTIVVGGVSKFLSVAGWRIGWIVTPMSEYGERLAAILKALASDVWSNVSTSIQYAVAEYLENSDYITYVKLNKKLHKLRNLLVYKELLKVGIDVIEPKAGFYIFANFEKKRNELLKKGIKNGYELQDYLLSTFKIAALCGANFGQSESDLTLRMSTSFLDCNSPQAAENLYRDYLATKNYKVTNQNHSELFKVIEMYGKLEIG